MSILEYLESRYVVSFELSTDATKVRVIDGCDRYYSEDLDKQQIASLIVELQTLHDRMKADERG